MTNQKIDSKNMANNNYIDSLFSAANHEINRNVSATKSSVENDFTQFFSKYLTENKTKSVKCNELSDCYRDIFDASNHGQIFIQNGRFNNEFIRDTTTDDVKHSVGYGCNGQEVYKSSLYNTVHKFDDQRYAVKQKIFVEQPKDLKRLLRELKVNAAVKYDYLLQYKSFWFESDRKLLYLYTQMELCAMDLKTVYTRLIDIERPNIVHLFVITHIFHEVIKGVNYLHNSCNPRIIHRNLKPENILLTKGENGRFVKIADFGFAVFHTEDGETHSQNVGTAEYMAPEVKNGANYGTNADIYSLGMVLAKISSFSKKIDTSLSDGALINAKINSLLELKTKMIGHIAKDRPTCERILSDQQNWLFCTREAKSNAKTNAKFVPVITRQQNDYDFYDSFFEYFAYQKIKSENANNNCNSVNKTCNFL